MVRGAPPLDAIRKAEEFLRLTDLAAFKPVDHPEYLALVESSPLFNYNERMRAELDYLHERNTEVEKVAADLNDGCVGYEKKIEATRSHLRSIGFCLAEGWQPFDIEKARGIVDAALAVIDDAEGT